MKVELIVEDPDPTTIHAATQPGWYKVSSANRGRTIGAAGNYAKGDILMLANGIVCNLTQDFAELLWDSRLGGGHVAVLPLGATAVTVRFQKDYQ